VDIGLLLTDHVFGLNERKPMPKIKLDVLISNNEIVITPQDTKISQRRPKTFRSEQAVSSIKGVNIWKPFQQIEIEEKDWDNYNRRS